MEFILIAIIILLVLFLLYQDNLESFDTNTLATSWKKATNNTPAISYVSIAKGTQYPGVWGISAGNIYFSPLTNPCGGDSPVWTQIMGPSGKTITSIVANDLAVIATASDMTTWYSTQPCNSNSCNWSQISKGTANSQVDVNTNQLWGIGSNQTIWMTPLPCTQNGAQVDCNWTQVNGGAKNIAVNDQNAWQANNSNQIWQAPISKCTTSGSNTTCPWQLITGVLQQISVDPITSDNNVWGVNPSGNVYSAKADGSSGANWTQIANPTGVQMQWVSTNGPYVWIADTNGNTYAQLNPGVRPPPACTGGATGGTTTTCNPACVNGTCTNNACVCNSGWTGPACGTQSTDGSNCTSDCPSGQVCTASACTVSSPSTTPTSSSSLSTGAIVGIVIGVIVFCSIMSLFAYIFFKKKKLRGPVY